MKLAKRYVGDKEDIWKNGPWFDETNIEFRGLCMKCFESQWAQNTMLTLQRGGGDSISFLAAGTRKQVGMN